MDYFLASGDFLIVDHDARQDCAGIRTGDIIAYMDWAGAPLVSVHRVLFRFRTRAGAWKFLTKGDANLWFDPVVDGVQVLGKAVWVLRGPRAPFFVDSGPGRAAGIFTAIYSFFAVLLLRACEGVAYAALYLCCLLAYAAAYFPGLMKCQPAILAAGLRMDLNMYDRLYGFFSLLPEKAADLAAKAAAGYSFPEREIAQQEEEGVVIAGTIKNRVVLSGNVTVAGDGTIIPGAVLVLRPGARVRFSAAKAAHGSALRACENGPRAFRSDKLCQILVYGEFVCEGLLGRPVTIGAGDSVWQGVIFLGRARGELNHVVLAGAQDPLRTMDFASVRFANLEVAAGGGKDFFVLSGCSAVELGHAAFRGVAYPVAAYDLARLGIVNCRFEGAGTAVYAGGAARCRISGTEITGLRSEPALNAVPAVQRVRDGAGMGVAVTQSAKCYAQGLSVSGIAAGLTVADKGEADIRGSEMNDISDAALSCVGGRLTAAKVVLSRAGQGLAVADGGEADIRDAEMTDIAGAGMSCAGGKLAAARVTVLRAGCGLTITARGEAAIRDCALTDIAGAGVTCVAGKLTAAAVAILRSQTGFALHSCSAADISGSAVRAAQTGIEATSGVRLRLSDSSVNGCDRGVWIQEDASLSVCGGVFENNSFAGIYTDRGAVSVAGAGFKKNNIGVFSDHAGAVVIDKAEFSANRTGLKCDRGATVRMAMTSVYGCEWDGIWCGEGVKLELNSNSFAANRHGIKEDGPCEVKMAGNKFSENFAADHLAWPHATDGVSGKR